MTVMHIPADDIRPGDILIDKDGIEIPIDTVHRDGAHVTTNHGFDDEITGYRWGNAAVIRAN